MCFLGNFNIYKLINILKKKNIYLIMKFTLKMEGMGEEHYHKEQAPF